MKKHQRRQISVFLASPGDLTPERKIFRDTIDSLNAGFADGAGVEFIPYGWEDALAETGTRPQELFNRQIEDCDLFILALHRRWGQKAPDSKFSSYTEEEFQMALKLSKKEKKPRVLVFFKTVDSASMADPGVELQKVLAFKKEIQETHAIWPRSFNTELDFGTEIDAHLRAFALGEDEPKEIRDVKLSEDKLRDLRKAERAGERRMQRAQRKKVASKGSNGKRKAATADLSLVKAQQTDLAFARAGADAADAGRIEDARVLFAKATEGTTDLSILSVAAEFFRVIGDLESASRLTLRQAAIARDRAVAVDHYLALRPPGFAAALQEQIVTAFVTEWPAEVAEEMRSIYEEAFGTGRFDAAMKNLLVKYCTVEELVELARFQASPLGQSMLLKSQAMSAEAMEMGKSMVLQVLLKRHPELVSELEEAESASPVTLTAAQPAQLATGDSQGPTAVAAAGSKTKKPN